VAVCAQCGRESPDEFGFCPGCGAPFTPVAPAREVRKVVTILFCDLTGSTAIGDRTDPEALRALMNRYYDAARIVLERHGGTVEKFVGDAVMAVFGIPVSTELDAMRAVRSAVELREVVHELGLEARIGINTGAVVAGEGDTLVTGDAVNVAARLEQAAGPGEILLGGDTLRLVRDAVDVEPLEFELKGKSGRVSAYRLRTLDLDAAGVARHLERPMVGRRRERQRLLSDFADVVAGDSCRLFTLIGPAGIGKSRLVADLLEEVGDTALVARGRARSYGEGITYWPLVEMLIQLGFEPSEAILSSPADTQLATRALLELQAAERPLVLVVDDLHWAEPPMIDLVEHVADWSRDAPILLLCLARPELLDVRPGWGGGKLNATSVLLEPLAGLDAEVLADELLRGVELDDITRTRILSTADGNPLFLEEMAALARDARGNVDVPPTIQALLQARLDTLNPDERVVIERGSVEGQVFHRGAVTALAPAPQAVDVHQQLGALVRKELVRPDQTLIVGDDAYRFRHLLIRDTAYEGLPKSVRADLHERFAQWLDANTQLVEQDEIVGYHFEQAARYRIELNSDDAAGAALAKRAAERLGAAGVAAFDRTDLHATRNLLERALALLDEGPLRRSLIPPLVDARLEVSDLDGVAELVGELDRGDQRDRATAAALRALVDPASGGRRSFSELEADVDAAQPVLERAGDWMGAARCERARAQLAWAMCQATASHHAMLRCRELLRRAKSTAFQGDLVTNIPSSAVFAGRSVPEVRAIIDELERDATDAGPLLTAGLRLARARNEWLAGHLGDDETRAIVVGYADLLRQIGSDLEALFSTGILAAFAMFEGPVEHERVVRDRVERFEALGDRIYLVNALADWAAALCGIGNADKALEVIAQARAFARADDAADAVALDMSEAYARALLGERERVEELIERVHEALRTVDMAIVVYQAHQIEASARTALGDLDDARAILTRLVADADRRGLVRFADLDRRDLAALDSASRD
jgi:class 3 adenylate cyclase/tetratricopeptide (TPR) repeat protein